MDLSERKGSLARRHPWEVARAQFFVELLRRRGLLAGATNWLDVGSGDAWFAGQLSQALSTESAITCWDVNYTSEDLDADDLPEHPGIRFTVDRPTDGFDRVLMLDVIEHVENDAEFVSATVDGLVTDNAYVLVSVPAYPALFSSHDRTLHHHRRYTPGALRRLLEDAGLVVVSSGGLFLSLLPVRVASVVGERLRLLGPRRDGVGDWRGGPFTTKLLTQGLVADGRLSIALSGRRISTPGLSVWALCRRRRA